MRVPDKFDLARAGGGSGEGRYTLGREKAAQHGRLGLALVGHIDADPMGSRALGGDAVEAGRWPDQRYGSPAIDTDAQRHGAGADRQIDGGTPEGGLPVGARPLPSIAVPRDDPTADVQR